MAPYRLPRLIGLGPARRLILSGEVIGAEEALRLGLVDHIVPAEGFEAGVTQLLELYLRAHNTASIASKRLMRRAFDAPFEIVRQEAEDLISECLASPEIQAAREAWQRRRAEGRS